MAEEIDSSATTPEDDTTSLTRRSRTRKIVAPRRTFGRVARSAVEVTRPAASRTASASRTKGTPVRTLVIVTMVAGLVATVALPAYGAWRPAAETMTLQQAAIDDAQTLVVGSDATAATITRDSYAATTSEEIEKKKAEEAAAERARLAAEATAAAAAAASASRASGASSVPVNIAMTSPGSGEVRWPILNFTKGRGLWDSGYHQGVDLLAPAMTPLYAAASGVVSISSEGYYGYGVAVEIQHVIGGQNVATLYGHMTYGTRQVQVGDYVQAGQLIGFVGSTGSSTANHVHFEVHINGSVVDPWAWLESNAG